MSLLCHQHHSLAIRGEAFCLTLNPLKQRVLAGSSKRNGEAKMASNESKVTTKETSWRLSLVLGVSLIALCLSLLCIVHLLLVPGYQVCECVTQGTKGDLSTKIQSYERKIAVQPTSKQHDAKGKRRERRNLYSNQAASGPMFQLQRQILLLEARVRYMQNEVSKRRSPGPRGPPGTSGSPGRNGMDGRPGMDGPMGMPGRDGKMGKDGSTGPSGSPGPPGVNGLRGLQGERGFKGMKGMMGDKGGRGLSGPKGGRGYQGLSGENGEPGMPGTRGRKGEKGNNGATTCYVTKRGRRFIKPCYLAPYDDDDADDAQAPKPTGVVYTRWGRTACPAKTLTVYPGQAASTSHGVGRMGGSSFKCVPSKPWFFSQRSQSDPIRNTSARANPEQETDLHSTYFYVTCAVCLVKTRSVQVMLPARKECYRGWHREYDGFLGVQINKQEHKEFVCVDRDANDMFRANDYIRALRADCDTFSCPPFSRGERLPCVVCTM